MPTREIDRAPFPDDNKYLDLDTIAIAKWLLGKQIFTSFDDTLTGGTIVETEAYRGEEDKACHAFGGRRTPRTATMYMEGGRLYVYLCYGVHKLLNIVTGPAGYPHVVLIRALQPTHGVPKMLERRNRKAMDRTLTGGPGALTQALGIGLQHDALPIGSSGIWIEEQPEATDLEIDETSRVGVGYAGEHAFLPYRFRIKGNPWTSPAK